MFLDWAGFMPSFLVSPEGWLGPFLNLLPLLTIGLFLWQQKLFMPPAIDEQSRVQQQVMKYMMFFMALDVFQGAMRALHLLHRLEPVGHRGADLAAGAEAGGRWRADD